ncbi:MAG: hypothetical protein WCS01_07830, partial [bacterium]
MKTRDARRWSLAGIMGILCAAAVALPVTGHAALVPFRLWLDRDPNGTITYPTNIPPDMTGYDIAVAAGGTTVTAAPATGYVFDYWEAQDGIILFNPNSNSAAVKVQCSSPVGGPNTNIYLLAHFKTTPLTLSVISTNNWGSPMSPAIGVSTWASAANISASVTTPFDLGGGNTAICTGYVGTGSVPAAGGTPNVSFQITTNSTLTWLWRIQSLSESLEIVSTNLSGSVGNPQPPNGTTNVPYNASIQARVTSPWDVSTDERAIVETFTGSGSAPSGVGQPTPTFNVTAASKVKWNWRTEYLLRVEVAGNGTITRSPGGTPKGTEGWWYPAGTTVALNALPLGSEKFLAWGGDISGFSPTNVVVMNGTRLIKANFGLTALDQDGDGLPDDWEVKFGLNPLSAEGMSGAYGDPDNDGLNNLQEYEISHVLNTNRTGYAECNPINADSDGDGLDDGYEYYNILTPGGTNGLPGSQANILAPVDARGINGPDANPDGDFHWNTATGYRTTVGLNTGEEYIGPDGVAPGIWVPSVDMSAYGIKPQVVSVPSNVVVGLVTNVVMLSKTNYVARYRNEADPLFPTPTGDSFDQSSSDSTDSELAGFNGKAGDGFDDGFEYSWDVWQALYGGVDTGDPLRRRVPFRYRALPDRPTAALLAPWFHGDALPLTNDMAILSYNYSQISFFENLGDGNFAPTGAPVSVGASNGPVAMVLGMFDAGGTNDIAVANQLGNSVSVLLRTPTNEAPFSVIEYPVGLAPSFVAVGLLNGDLAQDIAVANSGDGTVTILTNCGTGQFGTWTNFSVGGAPSCVAVGRIFDHMTNGPAFYQDLLVADGLTNVVPVACNTNTGTFTVSTGIPVGARPTSLVLVDFNKDYTNDFAVSISDNGTVSSYRGYGNGTFTNKSTASTGEKSYPVHLSSGALDYDYIPEQNRYVAHQPDDVVASAYSNMTGRIYLGVPDGTILPRAVADLQRRPVWSVIGDVNQDGFNDIVFVCLDDDVVSVWTGVSDGTFDFFGTFNSSIYSAGRPFNPGEMHDPPPGLGWPDYDLVYLQKGGVGNWWSDEDECNAWSSNRLSFRDGSVTNMIIGGSAASPRCTHPFMWDVDGDGLPDGWEVQFGYDPWKRVSAGGVVNDGLANPDLEAYAALSVVASISPAGVTNYNRLTHFEVLNYDWPYPNNDPWPPIPGYSYKNFNPGTGWLDPTVIPLNPGPLGGQTASYCNRLEVLGGRKRAAVVPFDPKDRSTNPRLRDTDRDGIWDGWELYTGLNPIDPRDAGAPDLDMDGLLQWQEFMCLDTLRAEVTWALTTNGDLTVPGDLTPGELEGIAGRVRFVAGWQNKTRPTSPVCPDTDDDQISDGGEQFAFNYTGGLGVPVLIMDPNDDSAAGVLGSYAPGGGLTPTSCDTDNDHLPDYWEASYAGEVSNAVSGSPADAVMVSGMDGTKNDMTGDADADGLLNYQEYMIGSVYHWQYWGNNGGIAWMFGQGSWGYEPFDFFDDRLSATSAQPNGSAMNGLGGRRPKYWDPNFWYNKDLRKPFQFMTAAETPRGKFFSSTDPCSKDTDLDGMDDYWETYHMLDPISGITDQVHEKVTGIRPLGPPLYLMMPFPNILARPPQDGWPELDWDQDGLPNIYESIQPQTPAPPYYHTDPSPYWLSDWSYPESWSDLYYYTGFYFGILQWWYWDGVVRKSLPPPIGPDYAPDYAFTFESNEGFDTDNDNLPDRAELVDTTASPGSTDPLDSGDPIKH